jgi:hypothetical protein
LDIDGLLEVAEISTSFIVSVVKTVERGDKGMAEFEPRVADFIVYVFVLWKGTNFLNTILQHPSTDQPRITDLRTGITRWWTS